MQANGRASLVSSKTKTAPKAKAKSQKPAVASRFNYLVQCKHDLKHASSCPMCKLVGIVTRQHFEDEKEKLERAHEQSLVNRAQLRLTLMMRWARCQSVLYNRFIPSPTFDIVFSKSLATLLVDEEAVGSRANPIDFDEVVKILNRRNRIQEVGHYAALYLQTRIRKYLAKRYVRKLMLQRFEYVPATRRKEAFYVDNHWMRKWVRTPRYLINEAPATPRTLSRRLAADDRVREARFERYKCSVSAMSSDMDDVWAQEETTVRFLKQLGILRDLVRIAMLAITRNRNRKVTAAAAVEKTGDARRGAVSSPAGGLGSSAATPNARRPSVMARSAFLQVSVEEAAAQAAATVEPEVETVNIPLQPVWICLSAPGCCARQLGLQLALATVPSPATGSIAVRTETPSGPRCSAAAATPTTGGMIQQSPAKNPAFGIPATPAAGAAMRAGSSAKFSGAGGMSGKLSPSVSGKQGSPARGQTKSAPKPPAGGSGVVTSLAQLHRSLQFLENSIWQCLKCSSPEEVLSKLMLEDLRPTFESVMNISQESKQIWHGTMGYTVDNPPRVRSDSIGDNGSFSSAMVSLSVDDNSTIGSADMDEQDEEYTHEVLPLTLQLRPFYADRGCNGFFRLFFYMDELIAVTASSPWAFYPEVLKSRDIINNSVRAYAAMPATKAFIQQFLTRANVHTIGKKAAEPEVSIAPGVSSKGIAASTASSKGGGRRPTAAGGATPTRRKSVAGVPPIVTTASVAPMQTDLNRLFIPPEELIYGSNAIDRAALQRLRDIAQFSDDKTVAMAKKYIFMCKNPAFADRLKRAELNIANRQKRRAAATAPTKAFTDASPFHQRLARLEMWRDADPYLPPALLQKSPLGDENNSLLVKDLDAVKTDLIGRKLLTLLQGPEAVSELESDTINVFDKRNITDSGSVVVSSSAHSRRGSALAPVYAASEDENSSVASLEAEERLDGEFGEQEDERSLPFPMLGNSTESSRRGSVAAESVASTTESSITAISAAADERNLAEYEAKLHRYSSKVQMEIAERLRKPPDVEKVKELFPLVVMDVYVQLPGKAGINPSPLGSAPSPSSSTGGGGSSSLFAVELQQIVGAFSCETDRPPPNLDCALTDWEHFYGLHQQRVAAFQQNPRTPTSGSSQLDALLGYADNGSDGGGGGASFTRNSSASSKTTLTGGMVGASPSSKNGYWTQTNSETGVSTYLTMLPSGIQYQFHMLGATPSKQYLEKTLPRKVKEWIGLPV